MERFDWSDIATRDAALARPRGREDAALLAGVRTIVEEVRAEGWPALVRHAERIDRAAPQAIAVAPFADQARRDFPAATLDAFALAVRNIDAFHRATRPIDIDTEPMPGLRVAKRWTPIASAGLYVPGGSAPLFSTLLMLGIPARVAGVEQLVVVTPPREAGGLDPAIALAAEAVGVTHVWTVGGAQAIAALAFGAGDIPAVARICGPGNAWVAAAKALVASLPGGPAIDLPAGPSELMVIADASANPATVAADLLSQAEHDPTSQSILFTDDAEFARAVAEAVDLQIGTLSTAQVARASWDANGAIIVTADLMEAMPLVDRLAPEHLELACDDPQALFDRVRHAGSVFLGRHTPEAVGDYVAGPNHVLPTGRRARFASGLSVLDFMKRTSFLQCNAAALGAIGPAAVALADAEGLPAHARSVALRLGQDSH